MLAQQDEKCDLAKRRFYISAGFEVVSLATGTVAARVGAGIVAKAGLGMLAYGGMRLGAVMSYDFEWRHLVPGWGSYILYGKMQSECSTAEQMHQTNFFEPSSRPH
jgi:hypothetical protein